MYPATLGFENFPGAFRYSSIHTDIYKIPKSLQEATETGFTKSNPIRGYEV